MRKLRLAIVTVLCGAALGWASLLFRVHEQPWSFIQMEDLHASYALYSNAWENAVSTILASNQAWNLKLFCSYGDVFEMDTNFDPTTNVWNPSSPDYAPYKMPTYVMTNDIWRLKQAGISCFMVPGNHDSDADFAYTNAGSIIHWDSLFGTNFYASDPFYLTNMNAGSERDLAFNVVVGSSKFLFIGLRWINNTNTIGGSSGATFNSVSDTLTAYNNSCNWARSLAVQYPDHNVIVGAHFIGNYLGSPDIADNPTNFNGYYNEGPGLEAWNLLDDMPNLCMLLSGHVRAAPLSSSTLKANDGHNVPCVVFNTQTYGGYYYTNGNNFATNVYNGAFFVLYTVYPSEHYIHARVFDSDLGRFLTNGEFSGYWGMQQTDFSFPIRAF